jgi:hypothetical protein
VNRIGVLARRRSVARIVIGRFRDDPELVTERHAVGGEDARALQKSLLVRLSIFLA